MTDFISWYILITILGWMTFPLTYRLFPALADRGYTLARAFGLLVWGFVFWLFATLGLAQNDIGGLLLGLIIVIGLSVWAFTTDRGPKTVDHDSVHRPLSTIAWVRENLRLILTTELLFIAAFALMAFIRASNPETFTAGGEKWMEVAFINSILHSPTFPPRDPWLSGYAISYYYFGYVMAAMLAKFTSTIASVAHNLMLSLIFALSAIGAYGILYNLLAIYQSPITDRQSSIENRKSSVFAPLFGPLFLLVISNLEGFLHSLHHAGLFWRFNADGTATSRFWAWLDIVDLRNPPVQPLTFVPREFFWWWRASRVVMDYDLQNNWTGDIISEFPAFSYTLGDLHPHVLAMPFMLLTVAAALNLFLGGWRGRINLFFGELRIGWEGFLVSALLLGGLAFLNTWDILAGGALIVFGYALFRVTESGWGWERIEDVLLLGIPVVIAAYVMYLPFFVGFDSQAGGILPSFMFPTRGIQLWVMWGTLFVPLLAYLLYLSVNKTPANWRAGIFTALGLVLALLAAMFAIGFLALALKPDVVKPLLEAQSRDVAQFVADSMMRRLKYIGGLLTLLAILIPAFSFLFARPDERSEDDNPSFRFPPSAFRLHPSSFILLLISLGILLILAPDFFYLRDNFGTRINTVFKFSYQAWQLLSLAAAFGAAVMFSNLRKVSLGIYSTLMLVVIIAGLTYPVLAIPNKTGNFKADNPEQRTLDGAAYLARQMPDDYQAFQFMQGLEPGVVAEAVGGQYSEFARISTFTGMPTVLGWPGHEGQWRDGALQGSRDQDIAALYSTSDWVTMQDIIKRYDIRYVVVGSLERAQYRVNEEKFDAFLKLIYRQGSITIYEAP
jgi:YYY domain-containing protein